jgi:hypothetical protein
MAFDLIYKGELTGTQVNFETGNLTDISTFDTDVRSSAIQDSITNGVTDRGASQDAIHSMSGYLAANAHPAVTPATDIAINNSDGIVLQDATFTFDDDGHVTAASFGTKNLNDVYYTEGEINTMFQNTGLVIDRNRDHITTLSGVVANNTENTAQLANDVTNLTGLIDQSEADIDTLSGLIDESEADIDTLSGLIDVAEADIVDLSGTMNALTFNQVAQNNPATSAEIEVNSIRVTGGSITGPSTITIDPDTVGVGGKVVIAGDLQVDGTTTTINSTSVQIDDLSLVLGTGAPNAAAADGGGIIIDGTGVANIAEFTFDGSNNRWKTNSLDIEASNFRGALVGNADSATVLNTAISVTVTGDVVGQDSSWDGSDSISVNSTISNNAVTTTKIANDAVTAAKLQDTSVTAGSYTAADITVDAQGRVTSASSGTISTSEIATNAVTAAKIATNAITTIKINADAVTSDEIANDSIDSEHIIDGAVDNIHLVNKFVTITGGAGLAGGGDAELGGSAVSLSVGAGDGLTANTDDIAVNVDDVTIQIDSDALRVKGGGIGTTQLANDAVTSAKLDSSVAGDNITFTNGVLSVADGDIRAAVFPSDSTLTPDRALVSDSNGKVSVSSTISTTELSHLNGVSSNIQTQLNDKADDSTDMSAGNGLTGGGTLAANRTFATTSDQGHLNEIKLGEDSTNLTDIIVKGGILILRGLSTNGITTSGSDGDVLAIDQKTTVSYDGIVQIMNRNEDTDDGSWNGLWKVQGIIRRDSGTTISKVSCFTTKIHAGSNLSAYSISTTTSSTGFLISPYNAGNSIPNNIVTTATLNYNWSQEA